MFRALIAEKNNQDVHVHVTQLDEQSLPDGDVVSTLSIRPLIIKTAWLLPTRRRWCDRGL